MDFVKLGKMATVRASIRMDGRGGKGPKSKVEREEVRTILIYYYYTTT